MLTETAIEAGVGHLVWVVRRDEEGVIVTLELATIRSVQHHATGVYVTVMLHSTLRRVVFERSSLAPYSSVRMEPQ